MVCRTFRKVPFLRNEGTHPGLLVLGHLAAIGPGEHCSIGGFAWFQRHHPPALSSCVQTIPVPVPGGGGLRLTEKQATRQCGEHLCNRSATSAKAVGEQVVTKPLRPPWEWGYGGGWGCDWQLLSEGNLQPPPPPPPKRRPGGRGGGGGGLTKNTTIATFEISAEAIQKRGH